jgi:predicted nucleotidyltransferase
MNTQPHNRFGLTERDMKTFRDIFNKYPEISEVFIFGSRAKGNYKQGSDIDLAVMNNGISDKTIAHLKEEFEESNLPYTVDIINLATLKHSELTEHIHRVGIAFYERSLS